MVTYDDMEKTATKRMVKIKGKIVYEPKGKGLIKITKCSGRWKPSSKSIYMTERELSHLNTCHITCFKDYEFK